MESNDLDGEYSVPVVPKRGDKLFVHVKENWKMDALLDFRRGDDYAYRQGYRMAGRILTESAAEKGWVDFLVYPICHAYRHYVELTLKHLMLSGCRVVEREMTLEETQFCASRDLFRLWAMFKRIEKETSASTGESYPASEMDGISSYIEQLHKVDKVSVSFRYPLTKTGEVSLGELERINLGNFAELMERLCACLESIDCYYGQILSSMADMYSDYSPY